MATLDMQEREQVNAFKTWWESNARRIVAALISIALILGAAQGWKYYQANKLAEAGTLYIELERQMASNDPKRINDAAALIIEKYSQTAYAPRAALLAAQVNLYVADTAKARTQLRWVIDHAEEAGLKNVARLKLASLLLDEKDYAGALALLEATPEDAFVGLYADLKGDALSLQGKTEEARIAYQQALDRTEAKNAYRNLIQMKLDGLGK